MDHMLVRPFLRSSQILVGLCGVITTIDLLIDASSTLEGLLACQGQRSLFSGLQAHPAVLIETFLVWVSLALFATFGLPGRHFRYPSAVAAVLLIGMCGLIVAHWRVEIADLKLVLANPLMNPSDCTGEEGVSDLQPFLLLNWCGETFLLGVFAIKIVSIVIAWARIRAASALSRLQ